MLLFPCFPGALQEQMGPALPLTGFVTLDKFFKLCASVSSCVKWDTTSFDEWDNPQKALNTGPDIE